MTPSLPRLLQILIPLAFIPLVGGALAIAVGIRVVWTDSLPRGVYWVHPGTIRRGVVVAACLPSAIARVGVQRGYLPRGTCPGGAGGIAKIVAGIGGDMVRVDARGVRINGVLWPWSAPTATDWSGRPLGTQSTTYRVPPGTVLLMGLNARSWDARYFGPVPQTLVSGIATPLLIEGGAATEELQRRTAYRLQSYRIS